MARKISIKGKTYEQIFQPLYDKVRLKTAASSGSIAANTEIPFFSKEKGQTIQTFGNGAASTKVKTYADTNIIAANELPKGYGFLITGISIQLDPSIEEDFAKKFYKTAAYLEIKQNTTEILNLPLQAIPSFVGITGSVAIDGAGSETRESVVQFGGGGVESIFKIYEPIYLQENVKFFTNLHVEEAISENSLDSFLMIYLHGFMLRPISPKTS